MLPPRLLTMRRLGLWALLLAASPRLGAQGPALRAGVSSSHVESRGWERSFARTRVEPNDWVHGATVGAAVGAGIGVVFFYLAHQVDEGQTSPMLFVGPTLIGALVGGMIGSFSKK